MRSETKTFVTTLMLLALLSTTFFPGALVAQEQEPARAPETSGELQVAYVNLERALNSFPPYQDAQEELQEYQNQLQQRIDKKESELQELQKSMQFRSPEGQQEVQKQMQGKMQEYRSLVQNSEQRLTRKEQELLQPVRERVKKAVGNVGDEMGVDVIKQFDSGRSDVLWVSPDANITDTVVEHLEELETESEED